MLHSHTYNDETLHYSLIYHKNKKLGIYMDAYGHLELQVPQDTPLSHIHKLLEHNWQLIMAQKEEAKAKLKGSLKRKYEDGETFLYQGQEYSLRLIIDEHIKKGRVSLEQHELLVTLPLYDKTKIKKLLKRFYTRQCRQSVMNRIQHHQQAFRVKPSSVTIDNNQKAWGTCSGDRKLTFNWKLAMAPPQVLDYIVVHEMCHLMHLNHDRSFWRLVGKHMRNYKDYQDWLSKNGWKLTL